MLLSAALPAVFLSGTSAAAAPAPDPITGNWNVTYGAPAVVTMTLADGVYTETAKTPVKVVGSSCDLPAGTVISSFARTGPGTYAGHHGLWFTNNCSFDTSVAVTLRLSSEGTTLTADISQVNEIITFTRAHSSAGKCTKSYSQPASWVTERVASDVPGISDYVEPINVVISACSTVSLSEIQAALGDWDTVHPTSEDVDGLHFKCISPEKADVAGDGYADEYAAWRLGGCAWGNARSLAGTENHVRIWNQPEKDSSVGAWFITASYETACVGINLDLFTLKSEEKHVKSAMKFWHCVDGGPGSFGSDGYDRGAKDFANAVASTGMEQGWKVTETTITRPIVDGHDTGEDGVKFNGTVYVLTVTK